MIGIDGGSSILFIFTYLLIFIIALAIPAGFIFLIYFLIKKLIKYYKTEE